MHLRQLLIGVMMYVARMPPRNDDPGQRSAFIRLTQQRLLLPQRCVYVFTLLYEILSIRSDIPAFIFLTFSSEPPCISRLIITMRFTQK